MYLGDLSITDGRVSLAAVSDGGNVGAVRILKKRGALQMQIAQSVGHCGAQRQRLSGLPVRPNGNTLFTVKRKADFRKRRAVGAVPESLPLQHGRNGSLLSDRFVGRVPPMVKQGNTQPSPRQIYGQCNLAPFCSVAARYTPSYGR